MIVLASNSPRRRQILALAGWDFHVIPAGLDEGMHSGEKPSGYVIRLAREKAKAVAAGSPPGSTILSADTTVVLDEQTLAKPETPAEAVEMLAKLRGRRHQVLTAVAVLQLPAREVLADLCVTGVFMRDYRDAEIQAYVESGDPLDKAGAYAIQHREFSPVDRLEGCYLNVVGLPMCTVNRLLRQIGVEPPSAITRDCEFRPEPDCQMARLARSAGL
jgi:MAF protein